MAACPKSRLRPAATPSVFVFFVCFQESLRPSRGEGWSNGFMTFSVINTAKHMKMTIPIRFFEVSCGDMLPDPDLIANPLRRSPLPWLPVRGHSGVTLTRCQESRGTCETLLLFSQPVGTGMIGWNGTCRPEGWFACLRIRAGLLDDPGYAGLSGRLAGSRILKDSLRICRIGTRNPANPSAPEK